MKNRAQTLLMREELISRIMKMFPEEVRLSHCRNCSLAIAMRAFASTCPTGQVTDYAL